MHDLPDTEDQDAAAERYWPEGYKVVLGERLTATYKERFLAVEAFKKVYEDRFAKRFSTYEDFVDRLVEMAAIGAEKGADSAFEEIYASFRQDAPLPRSRAYARYLFPGPLDEKSREAVHHKLFDEYSGHHAYEHLHEDHYQGVLEFEDFINRVAELVIDGAQCGADDALSRIYQAFMTGRSLPQIRRRSRMIR